MNYFAPPEAARRYAAGRPFFHRNTIARVRDFLQLSGNLDKALDVACGTGLSTRALLDIADKVYATDISTEMMKYAEQHSRITYTVAPAEQLPFPDQTFDLITVCSGVHWFTIDQFLAEASRVLKKNGWLVLYENRFIAEMEEVTGLPEWFNGVYVKKFPTPPRTNDYDFSTENIRRYGLAFITAQEYKNKFTFSRADLISYFTTHSNITDAVENRQLSYAEIEQWLDKELTPYFGEQVRHINFGNWIKFIQKQSE